MVRTAPIRFRSELVRREIGERVAKFKRRGRRRKRLKAVLLALRTELRLSVREVAKGDNAERRAQQGQECKFDVFHTD